MNNCRTCKHLLANYEDEFVDERVWDICTKISGYENGNVSNMGEDLFVKPSFGCVLWEEYKHEGV